MITIGISAVFLCIALFVLIRGAGLFVLGAKQAGLRLGMSKFAIGVLIVGFGTSLPELASSLAAVLSESTEIVVANAVGSNITNVLLVVGMLGTLGGRIVIKRELIKTELPIFFIATAHFLMIIYDGVVDFIEALLLIGTFSAYLWYLFAEARRERVEGMSELISKNKTWKYPEMKSVVFIILGLMAVLLGAKYTIDMVINIASALSVPVSLISITAIAIGTSLPELFVSIRALKDGEGELAIGNIFGSNAFNILVVVGTAGLFAPLYADEVVRTLGIPVLLASSAIFFVSGLARQIIRWEGIMLLLFFIFFLVKLAEYCTDCLAL